MYTLFYASQNHVTGKWEVYSEQYANIGDLVPIEGTTVMVSGNLMTEDNALRVAQTRQRASYSENRRQRYGA